MTMKEKLSRIWSCLVNRETVTYVICGVSTTLVDNIVFVLLNVLMKNGGMAAERSSVIASALSWVCAVIFAFIVNKLAVFRSRDTSPRTLLREAAQFFAARGISGAVTVGLIALFVGAMGMNEYIAKAITLVFNMVFNYVASKFVIFRKK